VDLVSFSGDKLLGGPQAGIVVGGRAVVGRLKKNPWNRALRIDKLTLAGLEATLYAYEASTALETVPTLRLLTEPLARVRSRARAVLRRLAPATRTRLAARVVDDTAGHIDHGKTSLVKALTGIDTDRLPEEKARGITIDLGFAFLEDPPGPVIEIVDVPGHERFVKNMLAGVGGIDLAMLVVAADEGVMPQTREHLAICSLLHIKSGLVVLTKTDLVERDWLELVKDDVAALVRGTFL